MNTSSLEITENEYCIKLNKEAFDLSLVRQLIKRIQAESFFFKKAQIDEELSLNNREEIEGFDYLEDK